MKSLVIIPARGGSKGLPGKNIKALNGKPLLHYSIDSARAFTDDENICLSSDDPKIITVAKEYGLDVPFIRPAALATDTASSYDVIMHAINFYESLGRNYDNILLLQPTSPFRKPEFIKEAMILYSGKLDMVVSVCISSANPYYSLFEENEQGYLNASKPGHYTRRQDCPAVYEYNGSIYFMNVNSLKQKPIADFKRIKKYLMKKEYSIDIDTELDWLYAELLLNSATVKL